MDLGFLPGRQGERPALRYDLVVDVNRNGFLDAGDLLDAGDVLDDPVEDREACGFYVVSRTDLPGPYEVVTLNYSGGSFLGQRTYFLAHQLLVLPYPAGRLPRFVRDGGRAPGFPATTCIAIVG